MGTASDQGSPLLRWTIAAGLAAAGLLLLAAPASAQDDPYRLDPAEEGSPPAPPPPTEGEGNADHVTFAFLDSGVVSPGGTNLVWVDPQAVGADIVVIRGCGNADGAGNPLPTSAFFDSGNCWTSDDAAEFVSPGGTAGTTLISIGVTGPGFQLYWYRWDEPIGANGSTCVSGGNYSCSIVVEVGSLGEPGPSHSTIFPVQVKPPPQLTVNGPPDPSEGDVVSFAFTGFATEFAAKGIGMCGNGDGAGNPLPPAAEFDVWSRCSLYPAIGISPGEPAALTEGSGFFYSDGTDFYLGTYVWHDTFATLGSTATCIDGGNFDCVVAVFDPNEGTVFPASYSSDPGPSVALGFDTVTEGDGGFTPAEVPVTLSAPAAEAVIAGWSLLDYEADFGDISPFSGFVTFEPGETAKTIPINVVGDEYDEFDELALLQLTGVINGQVGGLYGLGGVQILEDPDPPPVLIPGSVSGFEGDAGPTNFWVPVRLSYPPQKEVRVQIDTAGATATEGVDFVSRSAEFVVLPGWGTSQAFRVPVIGDEDIEDDERGVIALTNPVNATVGGFFGLGFFDILNDDSDCIPGPDKFLGFCDFSEQVFVGTDFSGSYLGEAIFDGAVLVDVDLSDTEMSDVSAVGARLVDTMLDDATVASADFTNALLAYVSAPRAYFGYSVFRNALMPGADLSGADLEGTDFTDAFLLDADLSDANLDFVNWYNTICPDGTNSNDNGYTCHRVALEIFRYVGGILPGSPADTDVHIAAAFDGSDDSFDPTMVYPWNATFGRIGVEAYPVDWDIRDVTGDGIDDLLVVFRLADTGLELGYNDACMRAYTFYSGSVYGCSTVRIVEGPPLSPPMSPPMSPPVSGLGSILADLMPLVQGPVGLMATAAALALVFLVGSSRTERTLQPGRREDGVDDDDGSG